MNESCHPYEWVMSPIWMSHVTYIAFKGPSVSAQGLRVPTINFTQVMSRIWMSYVTHTNVMTPRVSRFMTHAYVWHDSFICVTWLIHMCDMTHAYVWHDSFICVAWLIHMCDMTHAYVWHDSFICVPWLIQMCAMTHHACHESIIWPTWPVLIWK